MPYLHENERKGHSYWSISTSVRNEQGKPREKVLLYIGNTDDLKKWVVNQYLANQEKETNKDKLFDDFLNGISIRTELYGSPIALYRIAERIGVFSILNECFGEKTICGMSRGQVLTLVSIYQAIDPGSKRGFAEWVKSTCLSYHLGIDLTKLSSGEIWYAMDGITEEQIELAQQKIVAKLLELHPKMKEFFTEMHLDYTEFYTFISTTNAACVICQRGHSKQGRDDLRQFGLAMVTSYLMRFPLVWHLYPGNDNDKKEFPVIAEKLKESLLKWDSFNPDKALVVFDGGSISEKNLKDFPFHFICANSIKDEKLYDYSLDDYETIELDSDRKRQIYFLKEYEFSGIKGSGLIVFSQDLKDGECRELDKKIRHAEDAVEEFNKRQDNADSKINVALNKRENAAKKSAEKAEKLKAEYEALSAQQKDLKQSVTFSRRSVKKLEKAVQKAEEKGDIKKEILSALQTAKETLATNEKSLSSVSSVLKKTSKDIEKARKAAEKDSKFDKIAYVKNEVEKFAYAGRAILKEFTTIEVKATNNKYQATLVLDDKAKEAYTDKYFGKKLLTTDRTDIEAKQILIYYLNEWVVEVIFRDSKNPDHFSVRAQYHWLPDKIRVHVFLCIIALILAEELLTFVTDAGLEGYNRNNIIDKLSTIRDGWLMTRTDGKRRKAKRVMEEIEDENIVKLWDLIETLPCKIGSYNKSK